MSELPLQIYSDDEGMPWMAFVVGEADPAAVAAAITPQWVEDETGFEDVHLPDSGVSWPPSVKRYWLCPTAEDDELVEICGPNDTGAYLVTGHRFYPQ